MSPTEPGGPAIRRGRLILLTLLTVLLARSSPATMLRELFPRYTAHPPHLRAVGYVGKPTATPSQATLRLRRGEAEVKFNVTKLTSLGGSFVPADLLTVLQTNGYRLNLHGSDDLVDKLTKAEPDDIVEIVGWLRIQDFFLMLTEVRVRKKGSGG